MLLLIWSETMIVIISTATTTLPFLPPFQASKASNAAYIGTIFRSLVIKGIRKSNNGLINA
jgi:hypothetical protein